MQRRQEKKEKAQRTEDKSKMKSNIGDVITNIWIPTLNINKLDTQIKIQRLSD